MWKHAVLSMLMLGVAHADESQPVPAAAVPASRELLDAETRTAKDAATHGHCDVVLEIASRVERDPDYYTTTFRADPDLAACLAAPTSQATAPAETVPAAHDALAAGEMSRPAVPPVEGRPPSSGRRMATEAVLGSLCTVGGGFAGLIVGSTAEKSVSRCDQDELCLRGGAPGALTGMAVGATIGVYVVGTLGDETGSLAATFGGSVLGTLAGVGIAAALRNAAAIPFVVGGPVVGAMIGFNLTRDSSPAHKHRSNVVVPVASAGGGRTMFGVAGSF